MKTLRELIHPSRIWHSIPLILILLLSTACTPSQDQIDPTATASSPIEETVPDSPVPPTNTPLPPTTTSTPLPSATPLPTLTSTPAPIANITGNTNCRTGPGSVYDLLHTYLAGNQVQLLGKSPDGFFWHTRAVSEYAPDCWLWGKYVTAVGDTELVPVFTPPPTPTPSPAFEITYEWPDVAAGSWHFFFKIENTGSAAWESALLYAYEPNVPQDAGHFSNTFKVELHNTTLTKDSILPGDIGYFHSGRISHPGNYGKPWDVVDFYFTACTEENLGGYCVTKMWTEMDIW